ncbi:hypothetical protein, partial [Burkholderia ubonensis]|uniref:hypothetical protein n=1 Tax=Burkholderia ubonensis TaxID=101571 RepID=UPI001C4A20BB
KNVSARKPSFSAALRCQQQRREIMNTVSQLVNNFFTNFVATAGFICLPPSAPRCRQRERGVILGTSRAKRKGVREINPKAPVGYRARGLLC